MTCRRHATPEQLRRMRSLAPRIVRALLTTDWTVEALADELEVSRHQLQRLYWSRTTRDQRQAAEVRKACARRGARPWTDAELRYVREHASDAPAAVARALGRSLTCVYQARDKLGLCRRRIPLGEAFDRFVRERHAQGWSDAEVAAAWSARRPGRRPTDRHTTGDVRRRLGLRDNALSDHRRERVRAKTREQLAAAGVPSLGQLRVKVFQDRARAAGWPHDLRPRAVQILNALWDRGPMTRREIAGAVGLPWKGSRASLASNDPEGSYLAHLMAKGLVIDLGRVGTVLGKGRGRSVHVYSLPLTIERGKVQCDGKKSA